MACFGPHSSRTDGRPVDSKGKRVVDKVAICEIDLGSHLRGLCIDISEDQDLAGRSSKLHGILQILV